jgi:hypothetical protein
MLVLAAVVVELVFLVTSRSEIREDLRYLHEVEMVWGDMGGSIRSIGEAYLYTTHSWSQLKRELLVVSMLSPQEFRYDDLALARASAESFSEGLGMLSRRVHDAADRHAGSRRILVFHERHGNADRIYIHDDGTSLRPENDSSTLAVAIEALHERATVVGGSVALRRRSSTTGRTSRSGGWRIAIAVQPAESVYAAHA